MTPLSHSRGIRVHTPRRKAMAAVFALAAAAFTALSFASGISSAAIQRSGAAAPKLGAATIMAREHYFGLDNVDPQTGAVRSDRVLLSWTGQAGVRCRFQRPRRASGLLGSSRARQYWSIRRLCGYDARGARRAGS